MSVKICTYTHAHIPRELTTSNAELQMYTPFQCDAFCLIGLPYQFFTKSLHFTDGNFIYALVSSRISSGALLSFVRLSFQCICADCQFWRWIKSTQVKQERRPFLVLLPRNPGWEGTLRFPAIALVDFSLHVVLLFLPVKDLAHTLGTQGFWDSLASMSPRSHPGVKYRFSSFCVKAQDFMFLCRNSRFCAKDCGLRVLYFLLAKLTFCI